MTKQAYTMATFPDEFLAIIIRYGALFFKPVWPVLYRLYLCQYYWFYQ